MIQHIDNKAQFLTENSLKCFFKANFKLMEKESLI